MRNAYYYLFYKLYKFSEAAPSRWMSDWKAELSIDILEIFITLSAFAYYTAFSKKFLDLGNEKLILLIYLAFIAIPNYFIFHHKDKWKYYVHEFDKLPKNRNRIGSLIVWSVIIFIIVNLFFAFYLMNQVKRPYQVISPLR